MKNSPAKRVANRKSSEDSSGLTLSTLIEKSSRKSNELKEFANEKGEISNIEHIYRKVFGNFYFHN